MDRLKRRSTQGFSLLEVIIAAAIATFVLIGATSLLLNFGNFSSHVVESEASLMGTALSAFEEIVGKITVANEVTIPAADYAAPSIDIRISPKNQPATDDHTNDTVYTYWRDGNELKNKSKEGLNAASAERILGKNVVSLSFVRNATNQNHITVTLNAEATLGPFSNATANTTREHLETVAIMRSRSAN